MNFLVLLIGGLAVWRLSRGMVKENGPLMMWARLRAHLASTQKRSGGLYDMISCVSCTSFWIGLVASLSVAHNVFTWIAYGLAFSGVAAILESLFAKKSDTLSVVARPTTNDKVSVSTSTTSE